MSDTLYTRKMKGGVCVMEMSCSSGGCCSSGRGFLTRAEKVELLQDYKKQLDGESLGVAERIKELQRSSEEGN
ncbi:MAG: hypothetical protein AABX53_02420 [Nanoarchaeota archaeon]